uniref:CYTH domain-containing protein n=1 Tax=Lotharella globosa TaxID=91324 RepID=A0A7S4DXH4_9EUKA
MADLVRQTAFLSLVLLARSSAPTTRVFRRSGLQGTYCRRPVLGRLQKQQRRRQQQQPYLGLPMMSTGVPASAVPPSSPPRASSSSIEVERKFEFSGDADELRSRCLTLGGRLQGQITFTDTYWDTDDCLLTTKDIWLRTRDGEWELKLPIGDPTDRTGASGGERSVFREIEGEAAVAAALEASDFIPALENKATAEISASQPGDSSSAGLLENHLRSSVGMSPFASFATDRTRFELDGCAIDADLASFGHSVVEVELIVSKASEVPAAEDAIDQVAARLGLKPLTPGTGGKLETYLRRFCPNVVQKLVEAGVLPNV